MTKWPLAGVAALLRTIVILEVGRLRASPDMIDR